MSTIPVIREYPFFEPVGPILAVKVSLSLITAGFQDSISGVSGILYREFVHSWTLFDVKSIRISSVVLSNLS